MAKLTALLYTVLFVCLVTCSGESETVKGTTPAEIAETAEELVVVPTPTPGPTACNEVEGVCLLITFDGKDCTYSGPTEIKSGQVTFIALNNSEGIVQVNMGRHDEGKTVQDMIDYIEEEHFWQPGWLRSMAFFNAYPGKSYSWSGLLEPGIHTMVCKVGDDYFGGAFTVVD